MATTQRTITEEIRGTIEEIVRQVRKLIREGNARRIILKNKDGKVLFQSQLTIGIAGSALFAVLAPIISAITLLVMYTRDVKVLVERDIDETTDEYEVDAESEIIDIDDEEESKKDKGKSDKTVGKE